jgi:hypothetical protein
LHFRAVFISYCPQFWGSGLIYKVHGTRYMFERHDKKTRHFCVLGPFVSYCLLFWGSMEIYKEHDSLYILERNHKKLIFLRLWPFL